MIESYEFGSMVINGRKFTSDLIIYPNGQIKSSWWRKTSHKLTSDDIIELIELKPEIIIAGTGSSGLMKPDRELIKLLQGSGIEFIAAHSNKAIKIYNDFLSKEVIGACFHLTC